MAAAKTTIAVIGSGAAGLAAALAAAETRACTVLLLERAPESEHGGNTRWSPSYMRMGGVDRVEPSFVDDIEAVSAGHADRAYFERLAEEAPATIAWLREHGVDFHKPVYYLSAGPPRIQPVGGGAAVLQALGRAALEGGVEARYECRAQGLVTRHNGAVAGVEVTTKSGTSEIINADAVVLATGGFAGNAEMLKQHVGPGAEHLKLIAPGTAFSTGDGIRLALAAGARSSGDWAGMHAEPVDARSQNAAAVVLVYPYGIVVDSTGRRFFDEGAGLVHHTWEAFARTIHFGTPNRSAYAVLDAKLYEIPEYQRAVRSEVPPVEASSLPELAALIGVPEGPLQETIAQYNSSAIGDGALFDASRADGLGSASDLWPPKSNWCRPLDRPPYLAYPLVGAIAYTFGGIATDAQARVLGKSGPIEGLYAAGEITGHFYNQAPNAVAMLRALVFGRIAGNNATDYGQRS